MESIASTPPVVQTNDFQLMEVSLASLPDVQPGQQITVADPKGNRFTVRVPDKVARGGAFRVRLPAVPAPAPAPAPAPRSLGWNFTLDSAALARSVVSIGRDIDALVAKLESGQAVWLQAFGASVTEQGGCTERPSNSEGNSVLGLGDASTSRCLNYRGAGNITMTWGEPRLRPYKGFLVRLFEWINATWPHHAHRLDNRGLGATPAQAILPCFDSALPPGADLVILELGSMAQHATPPTAEAITRALRQRRRPPAIAFITARQLCRIEHGTPYGIGDFGRANLRMRAWRENEETPWDVAEAEITRVCQRYSASCVSHHQAVHTLMREGAPGFTVDDLAGDCVHPVHGRLGAEYMADMLVNWLLKARQSYHDRLGESSRTVLLHDQLPTALHATNARGLQPSQCYSLPVLNWSTGWCPEPLSRHADLPCEDGALEAQPRVRCPPHAPDDQTLSGPLPRVWVLCPYTLHGSKRWEGGLIGLVPGATLRVRVALPRGSAAGESFRIQLSYLASYQHAGVIGAFCKAACRCAPLQINAHRSATRTSTTTTRDLAAVAMQRNGLCELELRVLNQSSDPLGEHKFKLRRVVVIRGGADLDPGEVVPVPGA